MPEITFADVLTYVAQSATPEEVHALVEAGNVRVKAIRNANSAIVSALLRPDTRVELTGLKPKYLNGLTGKFVRMAGKGAVIKLDPECETKAGRYAIGPVGGPKQVAGIPVSALHILEMDSR